jgi:hypothetical protein
MDLVQVVFTGHHTSRFPGSLDCRQEQPHQDSDDRDDHQKFNERKTPSCATKGYDGSVSDFSEHGISWVWEPRPSFHVGSNK